MITPPHPDHLDAVVAFIAGQQASPERQISYVGTDPVGIRAELDGLAPPWTTTARVQHDGDQVSGVVITEWDDDLGRAWIHGPWVAGDGEPWMTAAAELLDAALAQVPADVTRYEMSGDVANQRLAALAAERGWATTEPNHLLLVDADVVAAWPPDPQAPALRPAVPSDVAAIAALHDAEFPDTYASAQQLVDGDRLVLVAEAEDGSGQVTGYAAGQVQEDGEGFVDFLAVDPAARGTGIGRRLTVALARHLLAESPRGQVGLLVQDHRGPARALYARLGFRPAGSLVAYRSGWATTGDDR